MNRKNLKRNLLIAGGTLSVIMAVIGILLPVLPTTPFLLLAAFCYVRSSSRFYNLLLNNRICGTYLKNYLEGKGMSLKYKIMTLSLLWLLISATIIFFTQSLVLRVVLGIVASGVTIHILCIKTLSNRSIALAKEPEKVPVRD